ncbi:SGNH hydrolase [Xylona heveae TC161]|uniref:SGNH hydrolase n=1 Tax=Xylona heveae (strain CBS 132557 / TC161) TaxID=1328760 RepID=A0A165H831_XYLHT|nr:SGNH hydrolase [Xylona heveae TC161]KZF23114.1 SGNH hydrolase [Xylona heveae TC161]
MSKPAAAAPLPKIVLFGDSLTEWSFAERSPHFVENGFGTVLEEKYAGRAKVLNRGRAGQTSTSLLDYFNDIIHDLENESCEYSNWACPLFFTIFLGANDACLLPSKGTYVPLREFEENIRYYVETLLEHEVTHGTRIILITPPPVNVRTPLLSETSDLEEETRLARQGRGYRTYVSKKRFADKIKEIAASYEKNDRVACLDLWDALMQYGRENGKSDGFTPLDGAKDDDKEKDDDDEKTPGSGLPGAKEFSKDVFVDGLHFGTEGYNLLSTKLLELISAKWPEL